MNHKLLIKTKSVKSLLKLFSSNEQLNDLSLGDTWHPSSGYVDEEILNGKHKVSDILAFEYDFKGLVAFSCNINGVEIRLIDGERATEQEEYEIQGSRQGLQVLQNKIIEENAYTPEKYSINEVSY